MMEMCGLVLRTTPQDTKPMIGEATGVTCAHRWRLGHDSYVDSLPRTRPGSTFSRLSVGLLA